MTPQQKLEAVGWQFFGEPPRVVGEKIVPGGVVSERQQTLDRVLRCATRWEHDHASDPFGDEKAAAEAADTPAADAATTVAD